MPNLPRLQYTPDRVHSLLTLHNTRLTKRSAVWRMLNAAYLTRFWEYIGLMPGSVRWARWNINGTEVEVNKLWRRVMTYKAALYRKTSRIECGADPIQGRGDAATASAVLNAIWTDERTAEQMDRAVEMAILFPGAGFKVGVDAGRASPLRRVWTRVLPWWELVLDADVSDVRDERFRGHRYWAPKAEIEDKYNLVGLKGSMRKDFLFEDNTAVDPRDREIIEAGDDGEFVEVFEFDNLVDWVAGKTGESYKGRQEIYILNQGDRFKSPIDTSPLAFADADGVGIPHIEYLIFNHEPSFPLRGVSPCERILPQLRETNVYRTHLAQLLRRNARKFFYKKGSLPDDSVDKLVSPNDMEFVPVEDETVDLREIAHPIPNIPISAEFWQWMGLVSQDDETAWGQSGPATGQSSEKGKTAYANQIEQFWTESEIGYHGQCLTSSVKRMAALWNRAIVHAMQSVGDATGSVADVETGVVKEPTELAPIGAISGDAAPVAGAAAAEKDADVGPAVAVDAAAGLEVGDATSQPGKVVVHEFDVRDLDGNAHHVTVPALDADFEIKFVDGGRTPMADAALLQFLTTQGTQYFEWFNLVMQGGPAGVVARAWMQETASVAQLPPSLHVDTLERKAKEAMAEGKPPPSPQEQVKQAAPAPAQPEPEPEPQAGAAEQENPIQGALATIAQGLQVAAQAAPEVADLVAGAMQGLDAAAQAFAKGDVAGIVDGLTALLDAIPEDAVGTLPEAAVVPLGQAIEVADQVRNALAQPQSAPEGAPQE